jgi:hypothetical protein
MSTTAYWLALVAGLGLVAAIVLARTVRRAKQPAE